MRTIFALATSALLVVGKIAYPEAVIPWTDDFMDCTSCIRGGHDYCIYGNE
jgi:hypothetical protein